MKTRLRWQVPLLFLLTMLLFSCNRTGKDPASTAAPLPLLENGAPRFIVTRGDSADDAEIQAAIMLNEALSTATGTEFTLTTDWVKRGETPPAYEILVGNTEREESAAAKASVTEGQFTIRVSGTKIVIVGATSKGTRDAVEYFIATYVTGKTVPSLPENLNYQGTYEMPVKILVIDSDVLKSAPGTKNDFVRLTASLQGLCNRAYAEGTGKYLIALDSDSTDSFWLKYMTSDGHGYADADITHITSLDEYFDQFLPIIREHGLVVWDPEVASTANVAATICGTDGFLPVVYSEDETSLYAALIAKEVPVKLSLCGMFTGEKGTKIADTNLSSSGSAKCDAYLWALEKYMDKCSTTHIAYVLDGAGTLPENTIYQTAEGTSPEYNAIYNHDYYVYKKMFFFDLTCTESEKPCDDPDQPKGTDRATLDKILSAMYERSGGKMIQLLGFPPWWMKYTTFHNHGKVEPTVLEWAFTEYITSYNCVKEADAAHPAWMSNGSFYTQYPMTAETYQNNHKTQEVTYDKNVRYFTLYLGDYDSSAWLKNSIPGFWSDSARGTLPLMWGFNPNLSDRVPMVWEYIMTNLSENDYIVSGDSGAGYVIPSALCDSSLRDYPDASDTWVSYCKPYFNKFDLDIVGFIINGNNKLTNKVMNMYNQIAPAGSFHNDLSAKRLTIYKGVPYLHLQNGIDASGGEATYASMYEYFKSGKINFAAYRTVCVSPSAIKNCVEGFIEYANKKDSKYTYVYVDPDTLFALALQSGQGKVIN